MNISIPGYQIHSVLYESASSLILRAVREDQDKPVVLKVLKENYPSPSEIVRYRQEYEITSLLKGAPGVIRTWGFEPVQNTYMIILEDFGAFDLSVWLKSKKLSLKDRLTLALHLVDALAQVHAAQVIHKNINPSNVLLNPQTDQLKLIDFGIATSLTREDPEVQQPRNLEANLRYIAPEQTGRMNRSVDHRADFYSLGATLYEVFAGHPPFETQEPLELIHCHLVREPIPLDDLRSQFPTTLSQIVLKLLSKTPELRYKSALGIKEDLEQCLTQLQKRGTITPFPIAQRDFSDKLFIPQKLYGRDEERKALLAGFERAVMGKKELMLLTGGPGVGKTSLVREVHRPMIWKNGYFLSGKFDPLQRTTPYLAIVQIFQDLVRQVLGEPAERIRQHKERILEALGQSGQILVDLIPGFELLLGPQPDLADLPSVESEGRFKQVLHRLVLAFARSGHPLVMFIDDLQWADVASLDLIQQWMSSPEIDAFYLIGACRDSEVPPEHPLSTALAAIEKSGIQVTRLSLGPLSTADINALIQETLGCGPEQALALTALVQDKTNGNPFFLGEFLYNLHAEGLLTFQVSGRCWTWDLNRIQTQTVTDNVVDLLIAKIQKLDQNSQRTLCVAASMKSQLDLEMLSLVQGASLQDTWRSVKPAVNLGLVLPVGEGFRGLEHGTAPKEPAAPLVLRFAHTRIQQAAYSLIPDSDRISLHRRVGETLNSKLSAERLEQNIFDVVNHLNLSITPHVSQSWKDELAHLNLRAGRKAKASAAHLQSRTYFDNGRSLLGEQGWRRKYEMSLALYEESAEAAFLDTEFGEMERLTSEVLSHATEILHKIKAYHIRIAGHMAQNQPEKAIQAAFEILRALGTRFPERPNRLETLWKILRTRRALRRNGFDALTTLPDMKDPNGQAVTHIMRGISAALLEMKPMLFVWFICHQMQLLLGRGINVWSGSILASFGNVLCASIDDVETGYLLGKIALTFNERPEGALHQCRTTYLFVCFVAHRKDPLQASLPLLHESFVRGLALGDLEYSAFCAHLYCQHAFFSGKPLAALGVEVASYSAEIARLKQTKQLGYNRLFQQVILNLNEPGENPWDLLGPAFSEERDLPVLRASNDGSGIFGVMYQKLYLACLFQRYDLALGFADEADGHRLTVRGMFIAARFLFFDALARLRGLESTSRGEQRRHRRRVKRDLDQLKQLARHAPENHQHLVHALQAELQRLRGDAFAAMGQYDQALSLARQNGFLNDEALIGELSAEYFLSQNRANQARTHLQDARHAYLRWGCLSKIKDLDQRHALLLTFRQSLNQEPTTQSIHSSITRTGASTGQWLDLESVIKASQSISSEMEISSLMNKLMKLVQETAGAEKAYLIMNASGEDLEIEASIDPGHGAKPRLDPRPLEETENVAVTVARFVFRTGDTVLLANAAAEGSFMQDPYIRRVRAASILCTPLTRSGLVMGVLYLENSKTPAAFTPQRAQLLSLLASQAAISLDNAKLYNKLKESSSFLEQALAQTRESARSKSEFYAKTSHELRTPLNAIINMPRGLLDSFVGLKLLTCSACQQAFEYDASEDPESFATCPGCASSGTLEQTESLQFRGDPVEAHDLLQRVVQAGSHLLRVVNDILDIGQLEAGRLILHPEEMTVGEVVFDAVGLVSLKAEQRQIDLQVSSEIPESIINADRTKIQQILINLLDNAIKFSPKGGAVIVEVQPADGQILFCVRDQGSGISKEDQKIIFESFRQAKSVEQRRMGGTGLGLAICKHLVELHGGQIWVESEEGHGSAFLFRLPRHTQTND